MQGKPLQIHPGKHARRQSTDSLDQGRSWLQHLGLRKGSSSSRQSGGPDGLGSVKFCSLL